MRGDDEQQLDFFSYVSPEQRISQDHSLRPVRAMADEALRDLKSRFSKLYPKTGRPSIAPEKLLRALLLQVLYSVRSERMLMEHLNYNLLFRWFVGLNMDYAIWMRPYSVRTGNVYWLVISPMHSLRQCSNKRDDVTCSAMSTSR